MYASTLTKVVLRPSSPLPVQKAALNTDDCYHIICCDKHNKIIECKNVHSWNYEMVIIRKESRIEKDHICSHISCSTDIIFCNANYYGCNTIAAQGKKKGHSYTNKSDNIKLGVTLRDPPFPQYFYKCMYYSLYLHNLSCMQPACARTRGQHVKSAGRILMSSGATQQDRKGAQEVIWNSLRLMGR